ncbi:MAG: NAD(P)H-dependent oxidoreductase subunit E [Bacteroidia bacterium]|nr:NAD(P)H-dependent oxidoreductase subunit E [Bacteroidia bacterium]
MQNNMYTFTESELAEIQAHAGKYPERRSAVMPALWIAQEKFGWLSPDAIKLVAETLDLPYAHVYGVASFYTMYFKEEVPRHLIEVCTCFSCGETGGRELYDHVKTRIGADGKGFGTGEHANLWVRQAECLGACDTAPVCQITNRRYVHRCTPDKIDEVIGKLVRDEEIPYEKIPLYNQSFQD